MKRFVRSITDEGLSSLRAGLDGGSSIMILAKTMMFLEGDRKNRPLNVTRITIPI